MLRLFISSFFLSTGSKSFHLLPNVRSPISRSRLMSSISVTGAWSKAGEKINLSPLHSPYYYKSVDTYIHIYIDFSFHTYILDIQINMKNVRS